MSGLREEMPTVARWVDGLRVAFGVDHINGAIRAGMKGRPYFWASEGGREIGTKTKLQRADEAAPEGSKGKL